MQANNTTSKQIGRLNTDFWKYWTGQTISNLGSSITLFALPLLVYKLTGSALNLGITAAAEFLPYLLFGLILGAWTDRVDRKRMMIGTDIARALIIVSIPLLYALGLLAVWWIYVVGFVHATLTICFEAGQFAAIPSLVNQDDLVTERSHATLLSSARRTKRRGCHACPPKADAQACGHESPHAPRLLLIVLLSFTPQGVFQEMNGFLHACKAGVDLERPPQGPQGGPGLL